MERLGKGGVRIGVGTGAGGVEHGSEVAAQERPRVEAQPRKDATLDWAVLGRSQRPVPCFQKPFLLKKVNGAKSCPVGERFCVYCSG